MMSSVMGNQTFGPDGEITMLLFLNYHHHAMQDHNQYDRVL